MLLPVQTHSAVKLSVRELYGYSGFKEWVDICKDPDNIV